ncbi:MAG: hypothetical protein WB723_08480 [Candidatus Acidiferrales bacterium]
MPVLLKCYHALMDAHPPDDDRRHDAFRDLCMLYGDFNRAVFLEEILNFIAGFGATKAEISAIRTAVQKRTKQLAKRPQRGRPRAAEDHEWMQRAVAAAYHKHVQGWSWSRVTESVGLKPTKPNIRTVQRQIAQLTEIIADAIPPEFLETTIGGGRYRHKLREGALDSSRAWLWLWSKTGLRFDTQPEECKKLVEALLR